MQILTLNLDSKYFDQLENSKNLSTYTMFMDMNEQEIKAFLNADPDNHALKSLDQHISDLNSDQAYLYNSYFRLIP